MFGRESSLMMPNGYSKKLGPPIRPVVVRRESQAQFLWIEPIWRIKWWLYYDDDDDDDDDDDHFDDADGDDDDDNDYYYDYDYDY